MSAKEKKTINSPAVIVCLAGVELNVTYLHYRLFNTSIEIYYDGLYVSIIVCYHISYG